MYGLETLRKFGFYKNIPSGVTVDDVVAQYGIDHNPKTINEYVILFGPPLRETFIKMVNRTKVGYEYSEADKFKGNSFKRDLSSKQGAYIYEHPSDIENLGSVWKKLEKDRYASKFSFKAYYNNSLIGHIPERDSLIKMLQGIASENGWVFRETRKGEDIKKRHYGYLFTANRSYFLKWFYVGVTIYDGNGERLNISEDNEEPNGIILEVCERVRDLQEKHADEFFDKLGR